MALRAEIEEPRAEIEEPHVMYGMIYAAYGSLLGISEDKDHFLALAQDLINNELKEESVKEGFRYVLHKFRALSTEEIKFECEMIPQYIVDAYPGSFESLVKFQIYNLTR